MLIRRCVYDKIDKDEIQRLFPDEVLPEIQRLLSLLLHKFQSEWREDVLKEQATLPQLKAMTWNMGRSNTNSSEPVAVINLKLQNEVKFHFGETELTFQVSKDTLESTLRSMYSIRDQFSEVVCFKVICATSVFDLIFLTCLSLHFTSQASFIYQGEQSNRRLPQESTV
ncbi:hypothetical protein CDL15_Pgr014889 [Punica granatum]|uniref:COMM domain-containing protein n=1 Tax=Punica granatum TaxID=22663 RepID=A0A218Y141_PUNGR|nr:hypothetical protein CDL15_Pgr014889 [Punica granatum]